MKARQKSKKVRTTKIDNFNFENSVISHIYSASNSAAHSYSRYGDYMVTFSASAFCENIWRLKSFICFQPKFHLICSTEFWIRLWKSTTAQKMKCSIKDFFSKCDQIRSFLRIWSHLLKKSLMESFIFCAVNWSCIVQRIFWNLQI